MNYKFTKIMQFIKRQSLKTKLIFLIVFLLGFAMIAPSLGSCLKAEQSCLASAKDAIFGSSEKDNEEINDNAAPKVEIVNVAEFQKNNFAVNTTGLVESTQQAELKSQVSEKVRNINVNLGDQVWPGQILVSFENAGIVAQLLQAEAGLETEKARLAEVKRGARIENIQIAESQVASAEISAKEAQINLENSKKKAQVDLENLYTTAINSLRSAADSGKNSILFITEIQYAYFSEDNSQESLKIATAKERAVEIFLGAKNAGRWAVVFLGKLEGGVFGAVQDIPNSQAFGEIDVTLSEMNAGLKRIKVTLEAIPISTKLNDIDKINLTFEKNNINGQIASISGIRQGIFVQEAGSKLSLNAVQMGLTTAKAVLDNAKNQLNLLMAGATPEQIAIQESRVKSAHATVNQVQAQIAKTIIRSPIAGEIAVLSVRLGELVGPGQVVVSVVNTKGLEVKAYVDSSNLFDISPGNSAVIEGNIKGVVTRVAPSVDPVTRKVEVKVAVVNDDQSELVVGQFVNINISVDEESIAENIYLIPLRAIKVVSGRTVVYVVNENKIIEDRDIVTGSIIGESVEVLEGINPEMNIIYSVRGLEPGQEVEIK